MGGPKNAPILPCLVVPGRRRRRMHGCHLVLGNPATMRTAQRGDRLSIALSALYLQVHRAHWSTR